MIGAEVAAAPRSTSASRSIWRNVADPPKGDGGRWILLEHELWSYAARDDAARDHLARRYRAAWAGGRRVAPGLGRASRASSPPPSTAGPAIIGVLLGLEMMRRIDPDAIDTATAVAALRGAVAAPHREHVSP